MPYGNTQGLIGEGMNPGLMQQDFSGYAEAARVQSLGLMSAANTVATQIDDYSKQLKRDKEALRSGAQLIDAASKMFPSQAPALSGISQQLKDENIPLNERAAMAAQVGELINMGVGEGRYQQEAAMQQRKMAMQEKDSSMRQWAFGQEVAQGERQAKKAALDDKTMEMLGGPLFERVISMAPASMADEIRKNSVNATPMEKYQLANSVMSLLPKQSTKAPTVQEFGVPGGKMSMQWDGSQWVPVQTNLSTPSAKVTTYGAPDDPYLDSNSAKGVGAFGKLQPNDIALSPDMEQKAKQAGIKPGETLSVTMENGDVIQGRWMDRTAQDSDVSSGKIKGVTQPLRGRVDLYTPGGVNPYDGMSVKGISKNGGPSIPTASTIPVGFTPDANSTMSPTEQIAVAKYADEQKAAAQNEKSAAAKSQEFVNALTKLENHPGFSSLFGVSIPFHKNIPGTDAAGAYALFNQIEGKGFLESIQAMKGMGALSNAEGEKVSSAFLGITPDMAEKEVKQRITEIKSIISSGVAKASAMEAATADPVTAASSKLNGLLPR